MICPKCSGRKWVWKEWEHGGVQMHTTDACPNCEGAGQVPDGDRSHLALIDFAPIGEAGEEHARKKDEPRMNENDA